MSDPSGFVISVNINTPNIISITALTLSYNPSSSADIKPYIPAFDSFSEARAGWMDDISGDVEVSRQLGYQSIVSNRGARAARAHARKTLGSEQGKGEGEGIGGKGEGELEVEVGAVEGSRARRRRENKEKKERELALVGVDGQFPIRREGRVREGTRRERGTGVFLAQSTEVSTDLAGSITAATESKVQNKDENKDENKNEDKYENKSETNQESRTEVQDKEIVVNKKDEKDVAL
jgi:hypothetical protein